MKKKREDFPHIDEHTLELVSKGCGGMYKTKDEIIMSVANSIKNPLPCGCPGSNYYVIQRKGKNILETISEVDYRKKEVIEVVQLDMEIKGSFKISIF